MTTWGGLGGVEHTFECPEKGFLTGIHGAEGNPFFSSTARVVRQLGFRCGSEDRRWRGVGVVQRAVIVVIVPGDDDAARNGRVGLACPLAEVGEESRCRTSSP